MTLSGDGTTAVVGGPFNNSDIGARGSTLAPAASGAQRNKLVGSDVLGGARQGHSVALSAGGNTTIVGGLADDRMTGAAWVYTRSGDVWTKTPVQQRGY